MHRNVYCRCLSIFSIVALLIPATAIAEEKKPEKISTEPLSVRLLLPEADIWRLSYGFSLSNRVNTDASPSTATSRTNSDTLSLTAGLSFGLNEDDDLSFSTNMSASQSRSQQGDDISRSSDSRFSGLSLGFSRRLIDGVDSPSLLASVNVSLAENTGDDDFVFGKSWGFGAVAYRVYEPLVVSGSLRYQLALEKPVNNIATDPGDGLFVAGSVNFAPNPGSTLGMTVSWSARARSKIDGVKQGIVATSTNLSFSFGYEWSQTVAVFTGVSTAISGNDSASISMIFTKDL